jgi:pimeloyl-ACP methyl ester carboxylesterase
MFGDADHTVPPEGSVEAYLALPAAIRHLHVFHGIDHSPNGIVPGQVAAVMTQFAQRVSEPAAVAT